MEKSKHCDDKKPKNKKPPDKLFINFEKQERVTIHMHI